MKTKKLAQTGNVIEATNLVEKLLARKRDEQRGLALIYGLTGYGKTAFAERLGFSRGWLYYRMKKEDTPKSFLTGLYKRLSLVYRGTEDVPRMSSAGLEVAVTDMLCAHPETVLIIDEVNLATQFRRWGLMEIIRDLIDNSFATIIMVGEEMTRKSLEDYNLHFFDRCAFFYEFKQNNLHDYKTFLSEVSEIRIGDDIAAWLHRKTKGNLRQAVKTLEDLESKAKELGLKSISANDLIKLVPGSEASAA